jgi:hypothetical protein
MRQQINKMLGYFKAFPKQGVLVVAFDFSVCLFHASLVLNNPVCVQCLNYII